MYNSNILFQEDKKNLTVQNNVPATVRFRSELDVLNRCKLVITEFLKSLKHTNPVLAFIKGLDYSGKLKLNYS